jgi:hypothetical protein
MVVSVYILGSNLFVICRFVMVQKARIYKYTMQQSRQHCVALYLEEEYEMLALETNFDVKWPNIPTFGNMP